MKPKYLYKILSPELWEKCLQKQTILPNDNDIEFIHLAAEEQTSHVIQKFWKGQSYVLLKLSTKDLKGRLEFETNPGGTTKYYHLYEGSIPFNAVIEATHFF